tara:strand:+ start:695 stop:859 length:165 start_codon:yes stop_codon:yes gene_type:complete
MSSKSKKEKVAEKRLKLYLKKKYGNSKPSGLVTQSYDKWLNYFNETISNRRISK